MTTAELPRAPRAETVKVEDLVADAVRGRIRVPHFQRGLKWEATDVASLFDSIYRGYPVGSLLLWRRPTTPDGVVALGPLVVEKPDGRDVRWLVDGQQRVTALAVALTRRAHADARFDVWFDPDEGRFHPTRRDGPGTTWVPVWRLLDAAELGEFLHEWPPGRDDRDRRRALLEAGKRIREYPIPAYVIDTDDDAALREIFRRTNRQGKQLQETDIFDALVVGHAREDSLEQLADEIASAGWGRVERETLLKAIVAWLGGDPTRRLDDQAAGHDLVGDTDELRRGIREIRGPMLATIALLREEGGIPHRRLLPYNAPLVVLPSFFGRDPSPGTRSVRHLVRWVWRGLATQAHERNGPLRRALGGLRSATGDGEDRSRALLDTVPRKNELPWDLNTGFRTDSARSRVEMLALASLEPLDLATGAPVDIATVLDAKEGLPRIVKVLDPDPHGLRYAIANRLFHPPLSDPGGVLQRLDPGAPDDRLRSHAFHPHAATALGDGYPAIALAHRAAAIQRVIDDRFDALAAWEEPDRPNLRRLVEPDA